jgi:hypothetical protein
VFAVREEVDQLRWERWPRIDDAIESYATFTRLRVDGVIPEGLRFQIGLPFPSSALNAFKADFGRDYPKAARGFEELVARELARLTEAIPPADLAIQWDNAYETQDIEGVLAWISDGAWEHFAGPVSRLTRLIPEEVLVGYHLCYGTFPEWPMYEAQDMSVLVRMANFAIAESGRPVDWLHLAGPRYCAARTSDSSGRCRTSRSRTRACSSASCCRSTGSPACAAATRQRRSSSTTSAWPCTADSAGSPAVTARRR